MHEKDEMNQLKLHTKPLPEKRLLSYKIGFVVRNIDAIFEICQNINKAKIHSILCIVYILLYMVLCFATENKFMYTSFGSP